MAIARHHAEWLALVEVAGPFLTLPLVVETWPQGLSDHDAVLMERLRRAHAEWEAAAADPALHQAWVRFVLKEALRWPDPLVRGTQALPPDTCAVLAEHGETLRPDLALVNPPGREGADLPRVLVRIYPRGQALDKQVPDSTWPASPAQRMAELLRAAHMGQPADKMRVGIVTNGEQWMLVGAQKGQSESFASWFATLWKEEPLTLRAWRDLLGLTRLCGVPDNQTLEALLERGAHDQEAVTTTLGDQVRRAIEMLVRRIDEIDKDRGRALLAGIAEKDLYDAALTVMMRLIFLFCAEERGLLLRDNEIYDRYYAVSTIREQLQEAATQFGEERLERFHDAWGRLLATFRAVYGGVHHEAMRLPAYGGHLFDPDRFPFLEGRPRDTDWQTAEADPLPIDNRTVLHLLEALQVIRQPIPGGEAEPRRVSFRGLDVEQIGHVYEGLLDHTARRATAPVLGLDARKGAAAPEVALADLEAARAVGDDALAKLLKERANITVAATLRQRFAAPLTPFEAGRLLVACDNDEGLRARVAPFFAVLRRDYADRPVVFTRDSVYVTAGDDRRSTGTHYTPRALTEPMVRYALEPLVYDGPAEGVPKAEWRLRSPRALLDLRVCDMAMGSGAFLVATARYLADRLLEAWDAAVAELRQAGITDPQITPTGELTALQTPPRIDTQIASDYLVAGPKTIVGESLPDANSAIPTDPEERRIVALRLVCDRCLYGVDINPMAVEMAKLSLWITTMARDRPFTFLDHALRWGDSLLGISAVEQINHWSLSQEDVGQNRTMIHTVQSAVEHALMLRKKIAAAPTEYFHDLKEKERLLREAEAAMSLVTLGADLLVGIELGVAAKHREAFRADLFHQFLLAINADEEHRDHAFTGVGRAASRAAVAGLRVEADRLLGGRRPFHWPLEFPEVFARDNAGFDVITGNPPFMGGKKITGNLGTSYRDYLVEQLADDQRGNADLCAYFFLRGSQIVRLDGQIALVATNTIAQGDTREVGLDQITARHFTIIRAVPSTPWPGAAALEVAYVWLRRGKWNGPWVIDAQPVSGITPFLTANGEVMGNPHQLVANGGLSFIGSYVLGMGFVLTQEAAQALIAKDPRNRDVLFPYLNGEDLNSRSDQSASRWVINFHDWPLERAETYSDCIAIVREYVKPERQRRNQQGEFALRKPLPEKWWIYADKRPALYTAIARIKGVLIRARVSNTTAIVFTTNSYVFSDQLVVFALSEYSWLSLLESTFHNSWVNQYSSTIGAGAGLRYTPSDCFETFPFPESLDGLEEIGETYYTHRQGIMLSRQEGLTKTYNRFHDLHEANGDIARLRDLHVAMDGAVATAYGWGDLDLGHGFHETKQGRRYTISPAARREVLGRLLRLNHERYAAEVAAGLHAPGAKRGKRVLGRTFGQGNGNAPAATPAPLPEGSLWGAGPEQDALPGMARGERQLRLGEGDDGEG